MCLSGATVPFMLAAPLASHSDCAPKPCPIQPPLYPSAISHPATPLPPRRAGWHPGDCAAEAASSWQLCRWRDQCHHLLVCGDEECGHGRPARPGAPPAGVLQLALGGRGGGQEGRAASQAAARCTGRGCTDPCSRMLVTAVFGAGHGMRKKSCVKQVIELGV